jgi:hypothetical protein
LAEKEKFFALLPRSCSWAIARTVFAAVSEIFSRFFQTIAIEGHGQNLPDIR